MTQTCHQFEHAAACDAVEAEIARLVAVALEADPGSACTTCPDWTLAQLFAHVGGVHRWAAAMVRDVAQKRLDRAPPSATPPEDGFAMWLAEGGDELVSALRASDPDAPMWAWGSDKHARFWPRRQLHETIVHRADAQMSMGHAATIDARAAVDGVDEFLDNLPHAKYFAPGVEGLRGDGERLAFACDEATWTVTLLPDRFEWTHDDGDASVRVTSGAGDMLLFIYGRVKPDDERIKIEGDRGVLDRWVENSSI